MSKYFAILRAINVGGHTVTMDSLRGLFEDMGFTSVETFIASGNVIFESCPVELVAMQRKIEKFLHDELGYEVKTFLRREAEVAAIATYRPFADARIRNAGAFNVGLLEQPLDAPAKKLLMSLKTEIDDFHVHGPEVYWLCQKKQSDSKFSNQVFEKTVKARCTFRGMNTIAKLAAKYIDM